MTDTIESRAYSMDDESLDICLFFFSKGADYGLELTEEVKEELSQSEIEQRIRNRFLNTVEELKRLKAG